MKTTYTYRLYHYKNGLEQYVFRAKEKRWFGGWIEHWVRSCGDGGYTAKTEWSNREEAVAAIQRDAGEQRTLAARKTRAKLETTLKLVIIEDIEA